MITISVSEARAVLPTLLDQVEGGEEITLTRHGKAVAVLVRPDVLRRRRNAELFEKADAIGKMLEDARNQPLPDLKTGGLSREFGEELIAEIRAGRDARP